MRNPLKWDTPATLLGVLSDPKKYPQWAVSENRSGGRPIFFNWVKDKNKFEMRNFLYHELPARLVDAFAAIRGQKSSVLTKKEVLDSAIEMLRFFTTHEWFFKYDNLETMLHAVPMQHRSVCLFECSLSLSLSRSLFACSL